MLEDSVLPSRATYLQHKTPKQGKPQSMRVAVPAVMRPGSMGEILLTTNSLTFLLLSMPLRMFIFVYTHSVTQPPVD